jgi:hypothetical protein
MKAEGVKSLPDDITGTDRTGDKVKTEGGTWKAERYVAVERFSGKWAWGASMRLSFTPGDSVDATKIALVQTVTTVKNNAFYYHGSRTTEERAIKEGASIDQAPESRSPLYADNPKKTTGLLGEAPVQEGAGEHGYRYRESLESSWKVKAAWLRDIPHLRDITQFSSQIFETTALAVAGKDQGTYYGSVSWGWYTRGAQVYLYPLSVESQGSVSKFFKESVTKWNETQTREGEAPQKLPSVG